MTELIPSSGSSFESQVFTNGEFELPLIAEQDCGFRIYAPLLAKQLGHRDAEVMVRSLETDEKLLLKGYANSCTHPDQRVWYVTEPGFYKVVGQRNINLIKDERVRAAVHRFQRWVFHDVLPAMLRAGHTAGPRPGSLWTWDEVASQLRQRYGIDYLPSQITMALRAAGWLKAGSCTPKHSHRNQFWHTGTAYLLYPHMLPELVADLVNTMREIGEPQAQQYQLNIFPALKAIEGGVA